MFLFISIRWVLWMLPKSFTMWWLFNLWYQMSTCFKVHYTDIVLLGTHSHIHHQMSSCPDCPDCPEVVPGVLDFQAGYPAYSMGHWILQSNSNYQTHQTHETLIILTGCVHYLHLIIYLTFGSLAYWEMAWSYTLFFN